jgi:hypothetical protein
MEPALEVCDRTDAPDPHTRHPISGIEDSAP